MKSMRRLKKGNKLDPARANRLLQIGFEFVRAPTDTIKFSACWHDSFKQLKGKFTLMNQFNTSYSYREYNPNLDTAYKDEHGNIEVPSGYTMPNGKKLDLWIARQRRLFREGKLPGELINKLETLDLNIRGQGRPFGLDSPEWMDRYNELVSFQKEHGDCNVPQTYEKNPGE